MAFVWKSYINGHNFIDPIYGCGVNITPFVHRKTLDGYGKGSKKKSDIYHFGRGVSEGQLSLSIFFCSLCPKNHFQTLKFFQVQGQGGSPLVLGNILPSMTSICSNLLDILHFQHPFFEIESVLGFSKGVRPHFFLTHPLLEKDHKSTR